MFSWYIYFFLCRLSSQIWGLVLRGDAKTLTPSPWTSLPTWSTDHCTDRSTDPPKKTIIKMTIRNSTYRLFCFLLLLPPSLWRWKEDLRTSKETGFSCEPARWSCDICQWMPDFDSCQFILIWMASREDLYPLLIAYITEGVVSICARSKCDIWHQLTCSGCTDERRSGVRCRHNLIFLDQIEVPL